MEMANKRIKEDRIYADFRQAAALLRDKNLVWSADLDSIREDLAEYIETKAALSSANNSHLIAVVQRLIADENDLAVD
jgi:hypothetical protein